MSTHQIHFARASGLPDAKTIAKAAKEYAASQNAKSLYLVRDIKDKNGHFAAGLIAQADAPVKVIGKDLAKPVVDVHYILKATAFDLEVYPTQDCIVTNGAGRKSLVCACDEFLIGELALPVLWDRITLPVLETIDKLQKLCAKMIGIDFLGARKSTIADYCHDSYMIGNYAAQFLDPVHGHDFMNEYENSIKSANVRLRIDDMPVTLKLAGESSFSFTTKADADTRHIVEICRQLAGWKEK